MRPLNAKKMIQKTYTVELPFFQLNILILTRFFDGTKIHSRSFTNPLCGNSRLAKHYDQTLDIRDTTRQN